MPLSRRHSSRVSYLDSFADHLEAVLGLRVELPGEEVDRVALADEGVALAGHGLGEVVERARRRDDLDRQGTGGELGRQVGQLLADLDVGLARRACAQAQVLGG